jgi:hypothetical protein
VGHAGELLDVQDRERGVGDGFAEDRAGVGAEGGLDLVFGGVGVDEGDVDAEFLQGHVEEVRGAAVDGAGGDEVVAAVAEVQDRDERGGLAGGGHQGADAALEGGQLLFRGFGRGVAEARVEVAGRFEVEEVSDVFAAVVLERGALEDGQHARLAVFRLPAFLDAKGVGVE